MGINLSYSSKLTGSTIVSAISCAVRTPDTENDSGIIISKKNAYP